ncbi:hypothetical protein [Leptobacterium sp. I13]|uniref:hypothetical protein n=1 Tax=Leptobacterium meishanense TaxID=3128904 RepID=UPI0030ED55FF
MELTINKEEFKYALSEFGKGEIFEEFAHSFLSQVLGDEFIPVGGTKDKGIDGSLKVYSRSTHPTFIYQISTELGYEKKIQGSIEKLIMNDVNVDRLIYVTGRKVNQKNTIEDNFIQTNKINLTIYDVEWFASNVTNDERLIQLYNSYIESNIHQFRKPQNEYIVGNYIKDPRLYVFMRQQFNSKNNNDEIEEKLADSLILYALEGTASETKTFKNLEQIKQDVAQYVKFNPKSVYATIEKQLGVLSTKPKQINYHSKEDAYCLPYQTRLILHERDIEETHIHNTFKEQTLEQLKKYLKDENVKATNALSLIEATVHNIYHKQGIEFSSFIIDRQSREILEVALPEIVGQVVDDSHIKMDNKESVKKALLMTIRNIAYNGTSEQNEYLKRLSYTYNMMFMLRWDPHLASAFQKLASQLKIYVGTSILIPALSEIHLEPSKRRYWSLLEGAYISGVQLTINETILDELVNHFGMIRHKYKTMYKNVEDFYLESEINTMYVDEILIRAYFYSKSRGNVKKFNDFIDNFAHPNLYNAHRDLKEFLNDEFHIKYEDTSKIEKQIDDKDLQQLTEKLTEMKNSKERAATDANLMLMVYKQREINKEEDRKSVFGYKTWWLSKDIYTYQAIQDVFRSRFNINCYMRSDFLFNYIAMAPKKKEIDNMFKKVFPSLLGINLSYHMPKDICGHINKALNEYSEKSPTMIRRAVRNYTEKLMSTNTKNSKKLNSFFDDELKKLMKK